jgi:hypothetical protein
MAITPFGGLQLAQYASSRTMDGSGTYGVLTIAPETGLNLGVGEVVERTYLSLR